jgi:hypothetical protein
MKYQSLTTISCADSGFDSSDFWASSEEEEENDEVPRVELYKSQ